AKNMDEELYVKLNEAIKSEENKLPIDAAVSFIGNTASIYHTLPMAIFITKRAYIPNDVLSAASHIGGNSDTISMICGALIGARFGIESLPAELLTKLERAGIFYEIAEKLFLIRNKNAGDAAETADIKNEDRTADKAE
ncbi:MAG TPA: ADP-ribosylglycohydrolase family protein, partial [Methanocorpusculum sp.]|nr:ADP-ribosylglycohydrolase family protein [Methanocorpusculum sp.]